MAGMASDGSMDHGSSDMGGMSMAGMMSEQDMANLTDATGEDFDRMWLAMMIAHHQGALTMAHQVLTTTDRRRREDARRSRRRRADRRDHHDAEPAGRMRRPAVTAAGVAAALALTGCAASSTTGAPSSTAAAPSTSSSARARDPRHLSRLSVKVAGDAWSHVHNLAYDGPALLLGTHEGLYRQEPGQPPQLLSETPFDVMGLTNDGTRWLASGHPGAGEDLPGDLGLRASDDGTTWTTLSLLGEVDFHRLTAAGSTILGVSAHDNALLRSTDAGSTFTRLDNPGVYDVALDPGDPTQALATTQTGPMASLDTGASWRRSQAHHCSPSSPGPRTGCTGSHRTAPCTSRPTAGPPGCSAAAPVGSPLPRPPTVTDSRCSSAGPSSNRPIAGLDLQPTPDRHRRPLTGAAIPAVWKTGTRSGSGNDARAPAQEA